MPLPGTERFAANTWGSCPRAFSSRASPSVTISTPARWSGKNWWAAKRIFIVHSYAGDYTRLDAPAQQQVQPGCEAGPPPGEPAVLHRQVDAGLREDGVPQGWQGKAKRPSFLVPA